MLGVKDCDVYLPSEDEVVEMIKQGQAAMKAKEPTPVEKKDISAAQLNDARTQQITAEITGQSAKSQLDYMSVAQGKPKVYS